MSQRLKGKNALITGASSGIGLATAVAAAAAGWRTIATVRDPDRADRLRRAVTEAGASVEVVALELTDPVSIEACVQRAVQVHGRLDALVNNAGAASLGTVEMADMSEFRRCLEVNFFGVVQMTRAALPHLRASGGRLVTVSSVGGVVGQPFNEAYCAAKFAVEGFLESLAPVVATLGVGVCVVEPGAVASSFVENAGLDPEAMLADAGPYAPALSGYLARTSAQFSTAAQSPAEVAGVILDALTATPLPFRIQTSDSAARFAGVKLADLDGARVQALTGGWLSA